MSVLTDIATFLAASGLGIYNTTPGSIDSTVFTHRRPDAPVALISVHLYGAAPNGPYLFDDTLPMYENPRIQVVARDPDGDTAEARCYAAWKALIGLSDVALSDVHYFSIRSVTGPVSQGTDENSLFLYGCNVQCMKVLS